MKKINVMPFEKVSVIIPTWNREKFIYKTINSVLKQTYQNFEILVCDDGSTDNTKKIVKSFNDNRIKWVESVHFGRPAIVRNNGLRKADGKWIAFLDSDDIWLLNKLEIQLSEMNKGKYMISSTNAFIYNTKIGDRHKILLNYEKNEINFYDLINDNFIINSSCIVLKNVIDKVGFLPENKELRALEDYAYWIRIVNLYPCLFIKTPLLYYRDNIRDSIRGEVVEESYFQKKKVINNFNLWCVKNNINLNITKKLFIFIFIRYLFIRYKLKKYIQMAR